ncbi:MAG: hypothetical protein R2757_22395 [Draconibacterium sp.]
MNINKLERVNLLLQAERSEDAQELFDKIDPEETVEYLLTKGNIDQKFQRWGSAINAYNKILTLDSDNKEAKNSLQFIQNILNFWNPETFNP